MSKQGVIGISVKNMLNVLPIKKHLLLFDKLIVAEETLEISRQLVELISKFKGIDRTLYNYNNDTIEQLINEGLLEFSKINDPIIGDVEDLKGLNKKEIATTFEKIKEINVEANKLTAKLKYLAGKKDLAEIIPDLVNTFPLMLPRLVSLNLNFKGFESYPLFTDEPYFIAIGNKETILRFILDRLPQPDDTVSIEQLIDFRKDPDTLKKYYSLVKWVNDIARKEFDMHEIQDEYNYLYHEYLNQFKIHKIKSKQSILEILVTAAIDVLSGQLSVGGVSTSLFSIHKHHLNLIEAESKFTGKEIAYIHKVDLKFKEL